MKKLVVLDYNALDIHIYDVDSEVDIDEEYISDLGFHTSECSWMLCEELSIIHHKEILK